MSRTGVQTLMDNKPRKKRGDAEAAEDARLQEELQSFEEEFGQSADVLKPKTFIRMDIVNANKSVGETKPSIYKPSLPNPLADLSSKKAPSAHARNSFEDAKRMAADRARKMMEDAHAGKPGPAPAVIVPTTAPPVNRPPKPGTQRAKEIQKSKTSNLDDFKEELKRLQAERDTRKNVREHLKNDLGVDQAHIDIMAPAIDNPYVASGSSADVDDTMTTTNLYIGNLPLDVTMDDLLETFGTFGPLASGKILYPRGDEERKREYLCGFVAYMHRKDFDRALVQMTGALIRNEVVKISYARSVNIPPVPFYCPPDLEKLSYPDPPTGLPFNAAPRQRDLDDYLDCWKDLPKMGSSPDKEEELADYKKMIKNATVRVVIPTDSNLLGLIHRTIEFIVREGPIFEAMLMARESTNPLFRFLFDNHHPAHVYYRWKLYSVLQGERPSMWRKERFRLFDEGSWWQPPIPSTELFRQMPECLYHTAFSVAEQRAKMGLGEVRDRSPERGQRGRRGRSGSPNEDGKEKKKSKKNYLSRRDRDKFEDMLRGLVPEKDCVGNAMVWCLDHAAWSKEIAECLYESLTIDETPLHKKIARLYLIADILANAAVRGVKDVFYYRQHFETLFPKIFKSLAATLHLIEGRLKAEQFKQRVMNCFRAWEDVTLYPTEILIQCQNVFLGLIELDDEEDDRKSVDLDGAPMEDDDDVDGVPLDHAAAAARGGNSAAAAAARPTTSVNWNSIQSSDDEMDGIPIDSGPNSPPLQLFPTRERTPEKVVEKKPAFKPMQWSSIDAPSSAKKSKWDNEEGEEENERRPMVPLERSPDEKNEKIFDDVESEEEKIEPKLSFSASSLIDDEKRKMMREVEVKVMALQDELEQDGSSDVKKKVEKYRSELIRKMEEKMSKDKKKEKKKEDKKEDKKDKKKEKEKDKERGRSRSRSRERRRSRERERSKEKERKRSRSRDREKEREKERERERDRDRRDRDRDSRRDSRRSRSRDRDRRSRSRDRRR
ncbi:hypothetical protein PFISCL1PPCAC_23719 [Pristionchus fissidentatus]|uniref:U2 snRNP-associated SURP motif-containing protein n=1 Tax=Pristionchus fissidentatus TaxID=1538716 RepID=A0AAV5WKC8_9BILA|nr:hypothetical protein PFISCL1PPCAC_23719 [Pristionchus fissidentatus]